MATPAQLVECVATVLKVPHPTVVLYDRMLSENGLRSKGGRGLNVARVTAKDAANLLIAIGGTPPTSAPVSAAVSAVEQYAGLRYDPDREYDPDIMSKFDREELADAPVDLKDMPGLGALCTNHTFRDGLVALIEAQRDHKLLDMDEEWEEEDPSARVEMTGRPTACIHIRLPDEDQATLSYWPRVKPRRGARSDLYWTRGFSHKTIQAVADLLSQGASKGPVA